MVSIIASRASCPKFANGKVSIYNDTRVFYNNDIGVVINSEER